MSESDRLRMDGSTGYGYLTSVLLFVAVTIV